MDEMPTTYAIIDVAPDEISLATTNLFTDRDAADRAAETSSSWFLARLTDTTEGTPLPEAVGFTAIRADASGEGEVINGQTALTPDQAEAEQLAAQSLSGAAVAVVPEETPRLFA